MIGTVYMLSPPDAPPYSAPDQTWQPYVQHFLFWNLAYAQPKFAPVATEIGNPLLVPLAAGAGQAIINEFTSLNDDALNEALEFLSAQSMQGSFWAATGGGSDSRFPQTPETAGAGSDRAGQGWAAAGAAGAAAGLHPGGDARPGFSLRRAGIQSRTPFTMNLRTLLTCNLTTKALTDGASAWTPPTLTFGESMTLGLRFQEDADGSVIEARPNVTGIKAAIGNVDARPRGRDVRAADRDGAGCTTAALPWNIGAVSLQLAINALGGVTAVYGAAAVTAADGSWLIRFPDLRGAGAADGGEQYAVGRSVSGGSRRGRWMARGCRNCG